MDIFLLILKIVLIIISSLGGLIYILFQLFQKIPNKFFQFSTVDYIVMIIIALCYGFGTNSYWGLCAFAPLLLAKLVCQLWINPKNTAGSGRWIEVRWKKLEPKGFDRFVSRQVLQTEMNKMPKDTHFIIPRLYFRVGIYFIKKRMGQEVKKGSPMNISSAQHAAGMNRFNDIINKAQNLKKGHSMTQDLGFGNLKVSRL